MNASRGIKIFLLICFFFAILVVSAFFVFSFKNQGPIAHASCYQAEPQGSMMRWLCKKALFDFEWSRTAVDEINRNALISAVSAYASTNPAEADSLIKLFISRGVDINAHSREPRSIGPGNKAEVTLWTALHLAALGGNPEEVSILLKNGARADVVDAKGRKPIDLIDTNKNSTKNPKDVANLIQLLEVAR